MLQVIQTRSLQLLETIVNTLDSYDEVKKRPRRFAKKQDAPEDDHHHEDDHHSHHSHHSDHEDQDGKNTDDVSDDRCHHETLEGAEKFKHLSFELIDMGLFFGEQSVYKSLNRVQQSAPYRYTDPYIHYEERAKQLVENSEKIYHFMNDKVYSPLKSQFYVMVDKTTKGVQVFVKVLKEHQERVADYIRRNYENVKVAMQDNWLRLDYNNDGKVSAEDLKKSVAHFYNFVVNYNYYLKAHEIKNKLYHEAIKYMQREIDKDEKERESHVEDNDNDSSQPPREDDDDIMSD